MSPNSHQRLSLSVDLYPVSGYGKTNLRHARRLAGKMFRRLGCRGQLSAFELLVDSRNAFLNTGYFGTSILATIPRKTVDKIGSAEDIRRTLQRMAGSSIVVGRVLLYDGSTRATFSPQR